MKIKCTYCRAEMNDYDEKCPNCGGQNHNLKRVGNEVPKTIEELQQWYQDMNLPPENVTRFFIGKDIKEPRAFGIYKDENTRIITVYKNKDDGTRAVRYEGRDEVYAVNEIYLKLKDEITKQKAANIAKGNTSSKSSSSFYKAIVTFIVLSIFVPFIMVIVMMIAGIILGAKTPSRGYYKYNDNYYYSQNNCWYKYDRERDDWSSTAIDEDFENNYKNYYLGSHYNNPEYDSWKKFENSEFYSKPSSSSSSSSSHDWDSSSSWSSSDSWDSSSTDWSSDW